jgi:hypothetical protein
MERGFWLDVNNVTLFMSFGVLLCRTTKSMTISQQYHAALNVANPIHNTNAANVGALPIALLNAKRKTGIHGIKTRVGNSQTLCVQQFHIKNDHHSTIYALDIGKGMCCTNTMLFIFFKKKVLVMTKTKVGFFYLWWESCLICDTTFF